MCLSSRMNVLLSLSLWLALMMPSCCGNGGSKEESTTENYDYVTETVTPDYDYVTETVTPDYDYNATFDYYYVTGVYPAEDRSKAAGIGPLCPLLLLGLAVHQIWK